MMDLAPATQAYLVLYLGTLSLHVVLMSYVLAGSAVVALSTLLRGERAEALAPIAATLRDWLPFALGAAITAGVAPLLFVQILYEQSFYTANLLLFHRWMAVVPVLMVGFYLLYLGKTETLGERFRVLIAGGAFLCFAFTAYSWAENHLLSMDRAAWPAFYGEGSMFYKDVQLPVRVSMWIFGAAPIMACIVGWQLRRAGGGDRSVRPLAIIAVVGTAGALVAGALLPIDRGHVMNVARLPVIVLAIALVAQLGAWGSMAARNQLSPRALIGASVALGVAVVSTAIARELIRLSVMAGPSLVESHTRSAAAGGTVVFAFFLVINAVLIGWCVKTAAGAGRAEESSDDESEEE